MRVLLISRCAPYPLHLGDRLIVYHLARELAARGHTIDLIAFSDAHIDPQDQAHYAAYFRHITLIPEAPRPPASYLARLLIPSRRFPHSADQAWSSAMWHAIRQHIDQHEYDVAHLFGGVQVYEFARAVEPLPALITPYESYALYLRRLVKAFPFPLSEFGEGVRGWGQLLIARHFEAFMFAPYRAVTVVSAVDRAELLTLNSALRVEVIANGVDLNYFQPIDLPRDPNMLLFTGNFEYAPNHQAAHWLIDHVLPRVRLDLPDAKLYLVGANPPADLQARATESIIVTGRVDDMRPYLAQAGAYVCPLLTGAGIKNKMLEAMAMRCAVVGTPIAFDGITVTEGEHAVSADHAGNYAEVVIHWARQPDQRDLIGARSRELIEARYSWDHAAASYAALYEEIAR